MKTSNLTTRVGLPMNLPAGDMDCGGTTPLFLRLWTLQTRSSLPLSMASVAADVRRRTGIEDRAIRLLTSAATGCRGFMRGVEFPGYDIRPIS
jgi:hypothetical protein